MTKDDVEVKENGVFRLKKDLIKQLYDLKKYGETYNDVVKKLLDAYHEENDEDLDDEDLDDEDLDDEDLDDEEDEDLEG